MTSKKYSSGKYFFNHSYILMSEEQNTGRENMPTILSVSGFDTLVYRPSILNPMLAIWRYSQYVNIFKVLKFQRYNKNKFAMSRYLRLVPNSYFDLNILFIYILTERLFYLAPDCPRMWPLLRDPPNAHPFYSNHFHYHPGESRAPYCSL